MSKAVPIPYLSSDTSEIPVVHCCRKMTHEVSRTLREADPYTCRTCFVVCVPYPVRYGLICHDREYGPSFEGIDFCPWCGSALPGADDEGRLL
ncbi:DUF6980 family protein [Variovorax paradoxus]|uniref:DUF6980 family protein n=1 Tax=Variovorax paradoxus TaxID=34073 RepID=UPI003D65D71E